VKRVRVNKLLYMATWIIYKAQHLDTALVLDRTRKPLQCHVLLADLQNLYPIGRSQFFQFSWNYAYRIYCQIHVKACFWGYFDPSDASISLF
jgi:hypothetical protein